ncbi:4'-phosphopantetheinyl transferase superfamily protein [Gramella sp. AN32]|uniref:4'-phosphopantetheinyl transferase superfamily protein n=1 Tax=Christiangramia antarctica TaxID=2058158 RepID=A0ABW5X038_9FLAO|nr:4'-phosphopantetheinyl transferase superfamily protein [Gramella sp. AN32]MCM4156814.1 hypothetical protein [Gramella sp. AN32]
MIGNDLVSLERLDQKKAGNPRFLQKIFTPREQEIIQISENPDLQLWQFWSAKESAYKAHQRKFQLARKFNPLDFAVDPNNFTVKIGDSVYPVIVQKIKSFIYSKTVFTSIQKFQTFFSEGNKIPSEDIIELIGLTADFQIVKNHLGIPSLHQKSSSREYPISISHEGKFSSFLIPLINY